MSLSRCQKRPGRDGSSLISWWFVWTGHLAVIRKKNTGKMVKNVFLGGKWLDNIILHSIQIYIYIYIICIQYIYIYIIYNYIYLYIYDIYAINSQIHVQENPWIRYICINTLRGQDWHLTTCATISYQAPRGPQFRKIIPVPGQFSVSAMFVHFVHSPICSMYRIFTWYLPTFARTKELKSTQFCR